MIFPVLLLLVSQAAGDPPTTVESEMPLEQRVQVASAQLDSILAAVRGAPPVAMTLPEDTGVLLEVRPDTGVFVRTSRAAELPPAPRTRPAPP